MDVLVFEILRSAVRMAKEDQIRSLATLRARLALMWPDHAVQREAAITEWAKYTRMANPRGLANYA
jgi:hypothetical protein